MRQLAEKESHGYTSQMYLAWVGNEMLGFRREKNVFPDTAEIIISELVRQSGSGYFTGFASIALSVRVL